MLRGVMHPEGGRDYSLGPREIGGLLYLGVAAFAIWILGLWWGIGIFLGILFVHAVVVGARDQRRQALREGIREGRVTAPVLVAHDAGERGDVPLLISLLTDPDGRLAATHRLRDLRARDAVPQLIRNLAVHNDLDRKAAVQALGIIGDTDAIPPLRTLASEDPSAWVRFTAIDALATLGDADGKRMLAQLATDPAPLLADADRYLQVKSIRHETPHNWRKTSKFAAKRLRELQDVHNT